MKMSKSFLMEKWMWCVLLSGATAFAAHAADTYWVDVHSTVTPATGEETAPYTKIQDAVNAAKSGDTIYVKPGVYGAEQGVATDTTGNNFNTRVLVSGKPNLSILATGTAADTSILGYRAANTTAVDNVCCVTIVNSAGCVLKGFTLANGGGRHTNGNNSYSGGVNDPNGAYGSDATAYVVDCVITNCMGTRGGGARGVNLVRCRLENNWANNPVGNRGGEAASRVNAYFCLFANHMGGSNYTIDYPTKLVNCTFLYNNQTQTTQFVTKDPQKNIVANCVFANVSGYGDNVANATASNCVVGNATIASCKYADGGGNVCSEAGSFSASQTAFGVMDAHLVDSSQAIGAGSRAALDIIPAAYRDRDLDGRLITAEESLNAGCYQRANPDYGCILFNSTSWEVAGYGSGADSTYLHPSTSNVQFRVKPNLSAGATLWGLYVVNEGSLSDNYNTFPDPNGWCYVMPKNKKRCRTRLTTTTATAVYYAAPDGKDTNDGLTSDKPMTLQGAVNKRTDASKAVVVIAAEGVYTNGTTVSFEHNTRLAVPTKMVVRGAGIGKSVICGRQDPNWQTEEPNYCGRGTNAVRCVTLQGECCVQGFTLTNGYTSVLNHQDVQSSNGTQGGGAIGSNAGTCVLSDCEIVDCCASRSAIFHMTRGVRCRIHACRETNNSTAQHATLINCYLYGNTPANGLIGTQCKAYGCTVNLNGYNVTTGDGKYRNCIFLNGDAKAPWQYGGMTNCIIDSTCSTTTIGDSCRKVDAAFVDKANADYRLTSLSPAIGFGIAEYDLDRYSEGSMDFACLQMANGKPTCGAWQVPVQAYCVTKVPGVSISDGSAAGVTNLLAADASVTITSTNRLIDHFCVDGQELAAAGQTYTLTAPAEGVPAAGGNIVPVLVPHLYADADDGSEDNNGLTAATPKKRLQSVLTKATAGDTVHLAGGRYNEGGAKHSDTVTILSRGVVPANVTLVGEEGAEKTFVCGEASTEGADTKGLGSGAMRCLYLGAGSTARGVTFTGGRTAHPGTASQPDNDDQRAGGVLAADYTTCTLEDCIISNCVAKRSSAARDITYRRCRILDNWAAWNSAGGGNVRAIDTYFDGNIGENTIQPAFEIVNCTYGPRNRVCDHLTYKETGGWTPPFVFSGTSTKTNILNSVVAGETLQANYRAANCVFQTCQNYYKYASSNFFDSVSVDYLANNWSKWFAADGSVTNRAFAGVDIGNDAARTEYAPTSDGDLANAPRVWNGRVDAGAREYDWRGDYAAFLGKYVTVTQADAMVRLADGRITLPDDTALTAVVTRPTDCELGATLGVTADGGALTVVRNEQQIGSYGTGERTVVMSHKAGTDDTIVFSFAGEGDTLGYLKRLKATVGMAIFMH